MLFTSELISFESKLKKYANKKENDVLKLEKLVTNKLNEFKEIEYSNILKEVSEEDKKAIENEAVLTKIKASKINKALSDQIQEKKTIFSLSAKDEIWLHGDNASGYSLCEDCQEELHFNDRKQTQKLKNQYDMDKTLDLQVEIKTLQKAQQLVEKKLADRDIEELQICRDLKSELVKEEALLNENRRKLCELNAVAELHNKQQSLEDYFKLQLEIDIWQRQQKDEEEHKRLELSKRELKENFCEALEFQRQQNAFMAENERKNELEFEDLMLQLLAEESNLKDLVTEARKRRAKDHRELVQKILYERQTLRKLRKLKDDDKERKILELDSLREDIFLEEEIAIISKYAPHLMPLLTPAVEKNIKRLL